MAGIVLLVFAAVLWTAVTEEMQKVKIVCVGDSITYGSGVGKRRKEQSYPAVLQKRLGENYRVLNYGLRSRTLLDYGAYPYTEEKEYQKTLKEKADIYIIMLGTNDSKIKNWNTDDYKEQLRAFVRSYQETGEGTKVYLMQPPRSFPDAVTGKVRYGIHNKRIANEIHKSVAEVGLECGAEVIDLYHLTERHADWFADGVHPNAEGYEKIADCIYKSLNEK